MTLSTSKYVIRGSVSILDGHTVNAGYTINQDMFNRFVTVLDTAIDANRRLFSFRVDLRIPLSMNLTPETEKRLIDRFVASFKAKIRNNRAQALKTNPNAHNTDVRYSWAREFSTDGTVHYHFVFYLNRDAFNSLGSFNATSVNIYTRLVEAWASALHIAADDAAGLVHMTKNAVFHLIADSDNFSEVKNLLAHNLSYMAKEETKALGNGKHRYGFSRN